MNRLTRSILIAAVSAALLAACATGTKPPQSELRDRAVHRWELIMAHKPDEAYAYLSPGFRATKSKEDYAREMLVRPVVWKGVKFMDQECDTDSCTVRLLMDFQAPMRGSKDASGVNVLQEKWIRVAGTWFYLPDQLGASVTGKGLH